MKKITALLVVDEIEACLPFWIDRLGFEKTVEVPHEDRLGFVILVHSGQELMLQSRASVAADIPSLADLGATALYVEVGELEPFERALDGAEIVVPKRKTFYGATEIGVRTPGGHVVVLAEMGAGGDG